MNKILEAYKKVDEAATKGEINSLYQELYGFLTRFNVSTEMELAGESIGLQIRKSVSEVFELASKSDRDAFVKSIIKELKKI